VFVDMLRRGMDCRSPLGGGAGEVLRGGMDEARRGGSDGDPEGMQDIWGRRGVGAAAGSQNLGGDYPT